MAEEREIIQLLKEYSTWHAAFGGAVSLDEAANMVDASYGPAGLIETGAAYRHDHPKRFVEYLAYSYEKLEKAKNKIKRTPRGMFSYNILMEPIFGDPGDWRIAERWHEVGDYRWQVLMWFVRALKEELGDTELHPIWPKPLSEREEKTIERQNAEIYATYARAKNGGLSHKAAVQVAATPFDLSEDAVERIIQFRDTLKLDRCIESGCDRPPTRGTLCMRHYQQKRRREAYRRNQEAS